MVEVLGDKVRHHLVRHHCRVSLFTSSIKLLWTLLSNRARFWVLIATSGWSGMIIIIKPIVIISTTNISIHRICEILRLRFVQFLRIGFHVIQHHLFDFISRENRTFAGLLQLWICKSWPPRYWLIYDGCCFRLRCWLHVEIRWGSQPWIWGQHKWIILAFFLEEILRISFIKNVITGEDISNPVSHRSELQILLILLLLFMAISWSILAIIAPISLGWARFEDLSILLGRVSSCSKHWIHNFTAIVAIVVTLLYNW